MIIVDHPGVRSNSNKTCLSSSPPHFLGRPLKKTAYLTYIICAYSQLHASDLRSLSPSSALASHLQDSPSSLQLPYVRFPPPNTLANYSPLHDLADKLAGLCGAQRIILPLDNAAVDLPVLPSSDYEKFVRLLPIFNTHHVDAIFLPQKT